MSTVVGNPVATESRRTAGPASDASPPFRFYDNRQKYLAFINTCNEKTAVARRAAHELSYLKPTPPALRFFDAGMGDATVLSRLMRILPSEIGDRIRTSTLYAAWNAAIYLTSSPP